MRIIKKIIKIFQGRTLYLVVYNFQGKHSKGIGSLEFKIYPKIRSYGGIDYIRAKLTKGLSSKFNEEAKDLSIAITNIIKLD